MQLARLIRAVEVMGKNASFADERLIDELLAEGYSLTEANQLVLFVPSAFARPVLEKLGVENFAETVTFPRRNGGIIDVPLRSIDVYMGALSLVRGETSAHALPSEYFRSLATRSAEIDAANKALNAGDCLRGGSWASFRVGQTADELGFES